MEPYQTAVDHETIRKIRSGQKELYADLVRRYHRKVMGHCLSILKDEAEAEEAAQDIFVKAYRSLGKFNGNSAFSTWLYRITANHCLDVLRRMARRRTFSLEALVEAEGEKINRFLAAPAEAAAGLENKDLASRILSALPDDYRAILTLREAERLEYREIAEALDCSLEAVKGRLSRARKQLREVLREFLEHNDVYFEGALTAP